MIRKIHAVRIFGAKDVPISPSQGMVYDQIRERLDSALTSVFTEDGKRTVLYYMTRKYSLTLEQASRDPGRLEDALTNLLGEIGWTVVKRKILEQFYGQKVGTDMLTVQTVSLRDAFGLIRPFSSGPKTAYTPF